MLAAEETTTFVRTIIKTENEDVHGFIAEQRRKEPREGVAHSARGGSSGEDVRVAEELSRYKYTLLQFRKQSRISLGCQIFCS